MVKKLKQADGKYVAGVDFWDREEELRTFTERVDNGAHQLLVGQRRMGKTSLLKEAAQRLDKKYVCLFVDLQKAKDPADAIVEIGLSLKPYRKLWGKFYDLFGNVLKGITQTVERVEVKDVGITLRAGLTAGDWRVKGDHLFSALAESDIPVLLMLDEVPVMLNRMLRGDGDAIIPEGRGAADQFMSWLRHNSLEHQGKVRIVISGSIGLEPVLHQVKLSATVNNFLPLELRPWDKPTAIGCLQALAAGCGVTFGDGAAEKMIALLGCCIPHHVQVFFTLAYDRCKTIGQNLISIDDANLVFKQGMLGIGPYRTGYL